MKKFLIAMLLLLRVNLGIAGENWVIDENGCKAFNRLPQPVETIEWTGSCKDGYLDGEGVLYWFRDGIQTQVYNGRFVQGKLQGKGTLENFNSQAHGTKIEAVFLDSAAHGQGVQTWPDGGRYVGTFKQGSKTGLGVKTWSDGTRYEGEFKAGVPVKHGFESITFKTTESAPYPEELFRYGNTGIVFAHIRVKDDARIEWIDVQESNHPAFERAAIKSYLSAKVKPAARYGKYVTEDIYAQTSFVLSKSSSRKVLPFTYPARANSQLPDELQYDKPPIDKVVAPLVYPLHLLRQKIKGSAKVSVVIDPKGLPTQVQLLESSDPAFGASLKAMVASSSFYPARKNQQPSWSAFTIERKFSEHESREIVIDENGWKILNKLKDSQPKIFSVAQLDAVPKRFYTPAPVYPPELADQDVKGTVLVEFYIDREGSVQFPHILKTDNEDLAWLALTAVSRWQFYPPTIKGEPVDAVVTVPVVFNLKN